MREKTIGGGLAAIDVRLTTQLSMVIGRIKKNTPVLDHCFGRTLKMGSFWLRYRYRFLTYISNINSLFVILDYESDLSVRWY